MYVCCPIEYYDFDILQNNVKAVGFHNKILEFFGWVPPPHTHLNTWNFFPAMETF